jgi:hypothetical protein
MTETRRAQIAATSEEAYEKACDRYNAISSTYAVRRAELRQQLQALDDEWKAAATNLDQHEDTAGIPLYNRCVTCKPGRALAEGHEGKCRQ